MTRPNCESPYIWARPTDTDQPLPAVSYVLTTFNSYRVIEDCLRSITQQEYSGAPSEILVADGGSTDGTIQICEKYGGEVISNPSVSEKGFAGGKTLGIKAAHNDVIVLLDSDNVLSTPDYTRQVVNPIRFDPEVVAVSPIISADPRWGSFERYAGYVYDSADYEYTLSCEQRTLRANKRHSEYLLLSRRPGEKVYLGNGTAVRRSAALAIGGYDFDLEAGNRLYARGKMLLSTRAVLFHHNAFSPRHYVRKKIRGATDFMRLLPARTGPDRASDVVLPKSRERLMSIGSQILAGLSIVYPAGIGAKKSIEFKDAAMMWHMVMAPIVTAAYLAVFVTDPRGRSMFAATRRDLSSFPR
jgi:glycosyltransferase involved in cell wall biosynthesis